MLATGGFYIANHASIAPGRILRLLETVDDVFVRVQVVSLGSGKRGSIGSVTIMRATSLTSAYLPYPLVTLSKAAELFSIPEPLILSYVMTREVSTIEVDGEVLVPTAELSRIIGDAATYTAPKSEASGVMILSDADVDRIAERMIYMLRAEPVLQCIARAVVREMDAATPPGDTPATTNGHAPALFP
jgi:hypothetical protein